MGGERGDGGREDAKVGKREGEMKKIEREKGGIGGIMLSGRI